MCPNNDTLVIFLDVDGVLNNSLEDSQLSSFNIDNFRFLWEQLGHPKIILSSDWQRKEHLLRILQIALRPIPIDGCTPYEDNVYDRKGEIQKWLHANEWETAIILDDLPADFSDPEVENVWLFKTDPVLGLTEENVDFILEYMKEKK